MGIKSVDNNKRIQENNDVPEPEYVDELFPAEETCDDLDWETGQEESDNPTGPKRSQKPWLPSVKQAILASSIPESENEDSDEWEDSDWDEEDEDGEDEGISGYHKNLDEDETEEWDDEDWDQEDEYSDEEDPQETVESLTSSSDAGYSLDQDDLFAEEDNDVDFFKEDDDDLPSEPEAFRKGSKTSSLPQKDPSGRGGRPGGIPSQGALRDGWMGHPAWVSRAKKPSSPKIRVGTTPVWPTSREGTSVAPEYQNSQNSSSSTPGPVNEPGNDKHRGASETSQNKTLTSNKISPAKGTALKTLLQKFQPLPPHSALFGVCEDGLPLLLDLSQRFSGSILFLGDNIFANRAHLVCVMTSICLLNSPGQVNVEVITPRPDRFALTGFPHCKGIYSPGDEAAYNVLSERFIQAEKSLQSGSPPSKIHVIAIDQLNLLLDQMESGSLAYFRWLLRRGPEVGVWVFATLETASPEKLDLKTARSFGSFVMGFTRHTDISERLAGITSEDANRLRCGEQALMNLEEQMVQFSIPDCTS